jgi:anti-anti-sigma factor
MSDGPLFRIDAAPGAHPACIACEGELDVAAIHELDTALSVVSSDVIVDCAAVTFMDAATIGLLVRHRARLERSGHALQLTGVTSMQSRVLEIVGLSERFTAPPVREMTHAEGASID